MINSNISKVKVFDVYFKKNASTEQELLPDIFTYHIPSSVKSIKDETDSDNDESSSSDIELLNTGAGAKSNKLSLEFFNNLKENKRRNSFKSLNLPLPNSASNSNVDSNIKNGSSNVKSNTIVYNTPVTANESSKSSLFLNDKWPSAVENAFLDSLRLIMKNGTYKTKIFDKNYGRNELISIYIKYNTGELRSKKQISSHIQVLKKAINSKIIANIQLDQLESELFDLIENGAQNDEQANKLFLDVFEDIIKKFEEDSGFNDSKFFSEPNGLSSNQLTPMSSTTAVNLLSQERYVPTTPLDHAKIIYKNLKDYSCVPSKNYSYNYTNAVSKNNSSANNGKNWPTDRLPGKSLMQLAKEIENQQRQLIDKLNIKQKFNYHQQQQQQPQQYQPLPNKEISTNNVRPNSGSLRYFPQNLISPVTRYYIPPYYQQNMEMDMYQGQQAHQPLPTGVVMSHPYYPPIVSPTYRGNRTMMYMGLSTVRGDYRNLPSGAGFKKYSPSSR